MKVFISQPMNGKTNAEIEAERERAVEAIKIEYPNEDIEVIDSFFKDEPCNASPVWFLAKALELMSTADLVFFAEGWTSAMGCIIEYECANAYGIKFMFAF